MTDTAHHLALASLMTNSAIEDALRQERLAIARLMRAEAAKNEDAAAELRSSYDWPDVQDEAYEHEAEAELLNKWADLIIARSGETGPQSDIDDEIKF